MSLSKEIILENLKNVIDPEVNLNIVDLGLVYGVEIKDQTISVEMTLTTQGCPMRTYMEEGVREALIELEGVKDVIINIVWDPPWSPEKINPEAMNQVYR